MRTVRAQKYAEIMASGELKPGEQHIEVEEVLKGKAAEVEAKIEEIKERQRFKENVNAHHQENLDMCRRIIMEDILSFKDIDDILDRARRKHAKKCFKCFDFDNSGAMDVEEFTSLMRYIDPQITDNAVLEMFHVRARSRETILMLGCV